MTIISFTKNRSRLPDHPLTRLRVAKQRYISKNSNQGKRIGEY